MITENESRSTIRGQSRLIPVTRWPDYHPWPSVSGLRHLIFFGKQNGFEAVIRRIGRRVLIDEAAFFIWADSIGKGGIA